MPRSTAKRPRRPQFTSMTAADARRLLRRNHVGRLAFRRGASVDIEPLGYVMTGNWIYLRSAPGTKLTALRGNPYVAFEVDEVEGPFDWRSVVVHGTVYMLPEDGSPQERQARARAVRLFRRAMPETLTPDDPVPERAHVYGLNIQTFSGRRARSR